MLDVQDLSCYGLDFAWDLFEKRWYTMQPINLGASKLL